jgi:hypothetical protein
MKKRYLFLLLVVLLVTQPASAYIDPGVGSIIWQGLIGIIFSAAFLIKLKWSKIKKFFEDRSQ